MSSLFVKSRHYIPTFRLANIPAIKLLIFCILFSIHVQGYTEISINAYASIILSEKSGGLNKFLVQDLEKLIPVNEIFISANPAYAVASDEHTDDLVKIKRNYQGFDMRDVLDLIIGKKNAYTEFRPNALIQVRALDGYTSFFTFETIEHIYAENKLNALLAYREILSEQEIADNSKGIPSADNLWTAIQYKDGRLISPGPFYIVWRNPEGTYPYFWPNQVIEITLQENTLLPTTNDKDINNGYQQTINNCMVCHRVNGIGGTLANGPDFMDWFYPDNSMTRQAFINLVKPMLINVAAMSYLKINNNHLSDIYAYLNYLHNKKPYLSNQSKDNSKQ